MKKTLSWFAVWSAMVLPAAAQMTREQKLADFHQLASLYAKNYAPYEWKRDALKFDLLEIGPWLERAANTKDDLDFYDVCIEYLAQLNDAHDSLYLPSNFLAWLGFSVDVYDGKLLVDSISRSRLPSRDYPIVFGDELVSGDGKSAEDWIRDNWKYSISANDRSTRRVAAALITTRPQSYIPRAHEIGETASVVLRHASGEEITLTIPWRKEGTPITFVGPVPSPRTAMTVPRTASAATSDLLSYLRPLSALLNLRRARAADLTVGIGSRAPIFAARPQGFTVRLGRSSGDSFYSGTFTAGGYRIGYLRIPTFEPASQAYALAQLDTEIAYFQENTDGLIVDQMRNPGGTACYVQAVLTRLMPDTFRMVGLEIRATALWVTAFADSLAEARKAQAEPWIIDLLEARFKDVETAYKENRGRTGPLAVCGLTLETDPVRDRNGAVAAYDKPLMVLVDEMSASGSDAFAAVIQDHGRGVIAGIRTMGAGGSVDVYDATNYSETQAGVTISLINRKWPIDSEGMPSAPYVENIGVHPEVVIDYMTRDNLRTGGRPFVDAFVAAMVEHITARRAVQ
jgi:hypothetical protein